MLATVAAVVPDPLFLRRSVAMSEPPAPDQEPGKAMRDASAAPAPAATRELARRFAAAASHDLRQPLQTLRLLNGSL
ncbi:MAG: hypothetical protein FJX69_13165, partial [Alphaproteobacteria bacterium]|nr:hypothetical protein [Alphaproteobacteria bacterium]